MQNAAVVRGRLLCALAYVVSFAFMLRVLPHHFGFPLDDSWIHEVVARNLAETHVLGFTPGELSSGSSSLLWTLILTLRALIVPSLSPVIYCAGIALLCLAGIGYTLKALADQDGLPQPASWCIALAPALSGNFLWFGLLGMEHLLFILLSLVLIRLWFLPAKHHETLAGSLPLACTSFLLVLTRPEGICLVALLLLLDRTHARFSNRRRSALAGAFAGGTLSACVNWITGHHLTPLTMQGRNAALGQHGVLATRAVFLAHSVARFLSAWGIDLPQHILHGRGLALGVPVIVILSLLLLLAVRRLYVLRARRLVLLCAWAVVIQALYFVMLPTPGHGGRYISLPVMLILPLIFFGLYQALSLALQRRAAWVAVAAFAVATACLSIPQWIAVANADIEQVNSEHASMARWIVKNLPPASIADRQIAAVDIGRIGYELHGNLIDLGGLVDYRFYPYFSSRRTAAYLQQHQVRYVVLPTVFRPSDTFVRDLLGLDPAHGVQLTPLHTDCTDPGTFRLTLTSSEVAFPCERLYSISYIAGSPKAFTPD